VVAGRPEPERIEIELTSNVGASSDPVFSDGDVVIGESIDQDAGSEATGERRAFLIATTVGVLALVLGWLIGRTGGSDEVATVATGEPVTTEVEPAELLPGETLPSAVTTTTRPRPTTTTSTLAPPSRAFVEVDPRLAGIELTLVGIERGNVIVDLDLAAQTMTRRDIGGARVEPGPLVIGDGWVVIADPYGEQIWVVGDDGSRQQVDLGEPWGLLWQAGTDRFWRPPDQLGWDRPAFNEPTIYEEIDLAGEPTGVVLELPFDTWSWQVDPGGGLLVERAGKLYTVDESSISLIGTGEVVALSGDIALMRDCDEQLECGLFVVDRSSGDVRPLPVETVAGEPMAVEGMWGWFGGVENTISPDQAMCAVMVTADDGPVLALLDLRSGVVVEIGDEGEFPSTVIWSPDGRFMFFLDGNDGFGSFEGGDLVAYDRRSGGMFPAVSNSLEWRTLGVRPT
jgi:hypothetical protein